MSTMAFPLNKAIGTAPGFEELFSASELKFAVVKNNPNSYCP